MKVKTEEKKQKVKTLALPAIGSMERCQAVLSVWTERRRPAEVCRELKVAGAVLSQWQKRALEGMLQALEPRMNLERGAALSPRLQSFLEKQKARLLQPRSMKGRLEKRLAGLSAESSQTPSLKTTDKAERS